MRLTGKRIMEEIGRGAITIEPFNQKQLNSNSYNLRLGDNILHCIHNYINVIDTRLKGRALPIDKLPNGGFLLEPGLVYLGSTMERAGSSLYIPHIDGRSSLGRHGVTVHITAGFGDVGFLGEWTLEIVNLNDCPVIIFPEQEICQISFEVCYGEIDLYNSTYQGQRGPRVSNGIKLDKGLA